MERLPKLSATEMEQMTRSEHRYRVSYAAGRVLEQHAYAIERLSR